MTAGAGRVLGVFAKWPEAGRVKTRLAEALTPAGAAAVAGAFLDDTLARLAGVGDRRVVVYAPAGRREGFARRVGAAYGLCPQAKGALGERLAAFVGGALAGGAGAVVVVGTDSPTYPVSHVDQAFAALAEGDVVLGPAADGGYCLVGVSARRGRLPPIFEGVPWSTADVLRATVERLADPGWRLAVLPPWYDVDTPEAWRALQGHLGALRRAGCDPGVPRTEALALSDIFGDVPGT